MEINNNLNKLLTGNSILLMHELPDESIDLIIADPPYNLGKDYGNNVDKKSRGDYELFTLNWLNEAKRILKKTGSIYVFMGVRFISTLYTIMEEKVKLSFHNWITWHYTQGMGRKMGFSPRHEDILLFTKSRDFTFNLDNIRIPQKYYRKRNNMLGANPGDVWTFSHVHYCSKERQNHPTQKPEALIERMILASSNENEIILDPFVGSGTTCRVAKILNRNFIGIDINSEYIELAKKRLDEPFTSFDSIDKRGTRISLDLKQEQN